MPHKPESKFGTEIGELDSEKIIHSAFRRTGAFLPQSPEEVAAAESDFEEAAVELPHSLRDPFAILDRGSKPAKAELPPRAVTNGAAEHVFACAARHGTLIPADVLQRMDEDEARARNAGGVNDAKK